MVKVKKGQVVMIEWLDIYSDADWLDAKEQEEFKLATCRSVGTVMSRDKTVLKLAHNLNLDDGTSDLTAYPMCVIQKVRVLCK